MQLIDADTVHERLGYAGLAEALRRAFREGRTVPVRTQHDIDTGGEPGTLLLMPAWQKGRHIGIKTLTLFPDNPARGIPTVLGVYILLDGETGETLAVIDGPALTLRRTAAASALAAQYLAREDAKRLLMVGAGALAPHLVRAHASVRPIEEVTIWNRTPARAEALALALRETGFRAVASPDLERAARRADVISCATMTSDPLVKGAWLKPGTHLDLVGGFKPSMREVDDDAVRAARLYVDVRESALEEAGDIVDPLQRGVIRDGDVLGDLFDLTRGSVGGRRNDEEITLFKSVGSALEDLAAAQALIEKG